MNLSKLYGSNIAPRCDYCLYFRGSGETPVCLKNKNLSNGSCASFRYEPTMREPQKIPPLAGFKPEDFAI